MICNVFFITHFAFIISHFHNPSHARPCVSTRCNPTSEWIPSLARTDDYTLWFMNYDLIPFPHGSFLLAPLRRNQPWAMNKRTVSTVRSWHWFCLEGSTERSESNRARSVRPLQPWDICLEGSTYHFSDNSAFSIYNSALKKRHCCRFLLILRIIDCFC